MTGLSEDAVALVNAYSWPGNIREFQNVLERAVILSDGELLTAQDLGVRPTSGQDADGIPVETLDEVEEKAIRAAMDKYSGNLSLVAKALNISRPTLYNKLKKYNI